ncbi:MAG: tetratricopeptide repeat protein [Firmicutes bacterium]|jgi:tetratricopeptide (TPR) repeat protein|nr:tetratricopeptide repeat protein [Bacillota bacterium]
MNLLDQCQAWHEGGQYQQIVDALEAIPEDNRTPEMDSELARAYNNLADVDDTALFEKAIALLKRHEEYFQGDHYWNFRMAYAYYFLNQVEDSLKHFEEALKARPGDEDTMAFIDACRNRLTPLQQEKHLRRPAARAWSHWIKNGRM